MLEKVIRWLIFSVLIALLPIGFNYLSMKTKSIPTSLEIICAQGELLIVSAALNAAALGELFGSGPASLMIAKIIAGGVCVIILLLTSLWFADIAATILLNKPLDANIIMKGSLFAFFGTVAASGSSVALSEV